MNPNFPQDLFDLFNERYQFPSNEIRQIMDYMYDLKKEQPTKEEYERIFEYAIRNYTNLYSAVDNCFKIIDIQYKPYIDEKNKNWDDVDFYIGGKKIDGIKSFSYQTELK